jgi:uncharacterized membrane protein
MRHTLRPFGRIVIIAVIMLSILSMTAWSWGNRKVEVTSTEIRIPVKTVDNGKASFYEFEVNGVPVEFFVLKSFDGVIRAAFNACDVCFQAKKGYSQKGDFMVCNNCGQPFRSDSINIVRGGCNPSPLERTVVDDYLVIRISDVVQGLMYFK